MRARVTCVSEDLRCRWRMPCAVRDGNDGGDDDDFDGEGSRDGGKREMMAVREEEGVAFEVGVGLKQPPRLKYPIPAMPPPRQPTGSFPTWHLCSSAYLDQETP